MAEKKSNLKDVDSTNKTTKKKGPPEFRHLPRDRAKKLKKEWIEKKKVKSQWRHERRKENMGRKLSAEAMRGTEAAEEELRSPTETSHHGDINNDNDASASPSTSPPPQPPQPPDPPPLLATHSSTVTKRNKLGQSKPPQISRTTSHPIRDTHKKHRTVEKSKKEFLTGKRRPVTMREKMGSLLEKIQKNMEK